MEHLTDLSSTTSTVRYKPDMSVKQAFGIAGLTILMSLVFIPVMMIAEKMAGRDAAFFIAYVLSMGAALFAAIQFRKRNHYEVAFNFDIRQNELLPFIVIAVPAIMFGVITPIVSLIPIPDVIKPIILALINQQGIFAFLAVVVAAPVFEELIFRGLILEGLSKKYSPLKSILISSALFGLIHLNPWQFVVAFVAGCFMGWVYLQTRSVAICIIIHLVNNLIAFVGGQLDPPTLESMDETLIDAYGGVLNTLLIIIGSLVVAAGCIYRLHTKFQTQLKQDQNTSAQAVTDSGDQQV